LSKRASNAEQSERNGPAVTTTDYPTLHWKVKRTQRVRRLAVLASNCPLKTDVQPGQMEIFGGRKMSNFMVRMEMLQVLDHRAPVADGITQPTLKIASLRRVPPRRRKRKRKIVGRVLRMRILWRVVMHHAGKRSRRESSREATTPKLVRGIATRPMSSQKMQREVCTEIVNIPPTLCR